VNAANAGAGVALFDWYTSSCSLEVTGVITGNATADCLKITNGQLNKFKFNRISGFRYGIYMPNEGGGVNMVNNQFWYDEIFNCAIGVYYKTPAGVTDIYEGYQFWGGFIRLCGTAGVQIESGVNANYSEIYGTIDCPDGYDYINQSLLAAWRLNLVFIRATGTNYILGSRDYIEYTSDVGQTIGGPNSGLFPASHIRQDVPLNIVPANGAGTGRAVQVLQPPDSTTVGFTPMGAMVTNDKNMAAANLVALHYGYINTATQTDTRAAFTRGVFRGNSGAGFIYGAGTYYTKRAGANTSDIEFRIGVTEASAGTKIGGFYNEGTRVSVPTSFTPSSSADAAGNVGDICWDATYLYCKTAVGAWRRVPWGAAW
jgi:hypothetical protein